MKLLKSIKIIALLAMSAISTGYSSDQEINDCGNVNQKLASIFERIDRIQLPRIQEERDEENEAVLWNQVSLSLIEIFWDGYMHYSEINMQRAYIDYLWSNFGAHGPEFDFKLIHLDRRVFLSDGIVVPSGDLINYEHIAFSNIGKLRQEAQLLMAEAQVKTFLQNSNLLNRYYYCLVWSELLFGHPNRVFQLLKFFSLHNDIRDSSFLSGVDTYYWWNARNAIVLIQATSRANLLLNADSRKINKVFEEWDSWLKKVYDDRYDFMLNPKEDYPSWRLAGPVEDDDTELMTPQTPFIDWPEDVAVPQPEYFYSDPRESVDARRILMNILSRANEDDKNQVQQENNEVGSVFPLDETRRESVADAICGPVKGQNWISPTTGMEFLWIPQLNLWVGKYEVTNGEYRRKEAGHDSGNYAGHILNHDRQPVVKVRSREALAYAEWLTVQDKGEGLSEGYAYRLPSSDEWLTFAQCGDGREYPWGDYWPPKSGQAGNYLGEEGPATRGIAHIIIGYDDGLPVTARVDDLWENPWGLKGVGGNVWEVCTVSDPSGWGRTLITYHGASWLDGNQDDLRCASRLSFLSGRLPHIGFRLVLTPQ